MTNTPETLRRTREKIAVWKKLKSETVPKTQIRVCKDCGETKPCQWMSTFSQGSGRPLYRVRCRECHNKYLQRNRKKPGYKAWRNTTRLKHATKRKLIALNELGGKCSICGYNTCIAALTFHHIDPSEKRCDIAKLYDAPMKDFMLEVKKCTILCQNCHAELHWDERRN